MKLTGWLTLLCMMLFTTSGKAQESTPQIIQLWEKGKVPMLQEGKEEDAPELIVYKAEGPTRTQAAVLICPGGGYWRKAMDHEGHKVARWLNSHGITAAILTYRTRDKGYMHPVPITDGRRALRTMRARAAEWGIDPEKIGVLGFSAGGHLASTLGTHFEAGQPQSPDPVERVTSRPNFMVLLYPVISFLTEHTHRGSRTNLLGENASADQIAEFSTETKVNTLTPPTFLAHTDEDSGVPPENSVLFYLALRRANVPAEMHIFRQGKHGLGLGEEDLPFKEWPSLCIQWMKAMRFI